MSKHDLTEYRFSQAVVADFPKIMDNLMEARKKLMPHRKYIAVQLVIDSIESSVENLNTNLAYYKKVLDNKGIKNV